MAAVESETLKAENARLTAEMTSMKKKIMLAMKKQNAEVKAAQQKAAAAEAALAAAMSASHSEFNSHSAIEAPSTGIDGVAVSGSSPSPASPYGRVFSSGRSELTEVSSNGEEGGDEANGETQGEIERLRVELVKEREQHQSRQDVLLQEKQRLEDDMLKLRETMESDARQRLEEREKLEAELSTVKETSQKRIEQLIESNQKLEARVEHVSKEGEETSRACTDLLQQTERISKELEETHAALIKAHQQAEEKAKELEQVAASRKAAQDGQEAALGQLMAHLHEMEAAVASHGGEEAGGKEAQGNDARAELAVSQATVANLREQVAVLHQRLEASTVEALPHCNGNGSVLSESLDLQEQDKMLATTLLEVKAQHEGLQQQLQEAHLQAQSLQVELQERQQQQEAAEAAALRLSVACAAAEQRADTLSSEIANAGRKLEEEISARDDKYAELDSKFGRLQKRAKQRIQEVQKEKEEVEALVTVTEEKAVQALARQAALQADLDRTRTQAGDALRTLDSERQQLRTAHLRLKEEMEELRHALDAKEHNLAESRRLASEKDQTVLEMASMLKEAEAKQEAIILDLKEKHQKAIEGLELQLADSARDCSKVVDTLSALQAQLADKEARLAEVEAASSGELVRLGAMLEAARGEVSRLDLEHRKEKEVWESNVVKLKNKLEESEKTHSRLEVAAAETRGKLESELEGQCQALSAAQSELVIAREETAQCAKELAAYKVRAYALLQKKEAELVAAQDTELLAAQEAALQEAKTEAAAAAAERDRAVKALQEAVTEYQTQLDARAVAILDAEQHIWDLATKLESSKALLLSQQLEWQGRIEQVEETCRLKCEVVEVKARGSRPNEADLSSELAALRTTHEQLKGEFDSYQELANRMMENKDHEISRLLDDIARLQTSLRLQTQAGTGAVEKAVADTPVSSVAVAEQQILLLARQQAQREEEVTQCRRHIQALQEEITELEHENRLHCQQAEMLKEELRNLERAQKRDGVDMTYLKNVVLKLLETGEVEALLPVIAMLLQFSPEELRRCHEAYKISAASEVVPLSGAAAVVDAAAAAPRSLLSRLTGGR